MKPKKAKSPEATGLFGGATSPPAGCGSILTSDQSLAGLVMVLRSVSAPVDGQFDIGRTDMNNFKSCADRRHVFLYQGRKISWAQLLEEVAPILAAARAARQNKTGGRA